MDEDQQRETSGAITLLVLAHVRSRGGPEAVAEVRRRAGLHGEGTHRDGRWTSYDARLRLYQAAVDVLGDETATFEAGAAAPTHAGHFALVLALRALRTPRSVLREAPRVVSRFSTTSTLQVLDLGRDRATLEYRLHERYTFSRLDCLFAQGLFASVPTLFGLPRARVEHPACQGEGHPACRYEVTWDRRARAGDLLRRRRRERAIDVEALRGQMEQLQQVASDLAGSEDVGQALERIVDRAASAVLAPAYLLVLTADDGPPVVRHRGLTEDAAVRVADRVVCEGRAGPGVTVVDVVSQRHHHGHLVVLHGSDHDPIPAEIDLLQAYARHAAAALDLLTALERSRTEEARATALLGLAAALAAAEDETEAARVVADALRDVAGCRSASVLLWDSSAGELRAAATTGHTPQEEAVLRGSALRADEVPELSTLLARREPVLLDVATASPRLSTFLAAVNARRVVVAPLVAGEVFLGVAAASWGDATAVEQLRGEARSRVIAVSSQGATALERARLIATVRHQAQHDPLSGLPNRALFTRALGDQLRAAEPGTGTAVLFCDLDRFKAVNVELGHAAGDELLRQVAARLRGVFRPRDVLGRLSGDEFAVVVSAVDEPGAVAMARRVVDALDVPFRLDGREVRVTVSVGIALHEGPDGRGDTLLAAADGAMHVAKHRGRNQVAVAGATPDRLVVPSLEAELGRAVGAGQMRLYFQPLVDLSGADGPVVTGAEALIRWAHPRLGLLAPGAFLPLAEEAGLVTELDLWAVDAACAALAQWPDVCGAPLSVAVNLAGSTLVDPRLPGAVRAALREHDIPAGRLHLEVVESRSLVDLPGVIEHLAELRQMGLRIALDDFGTGYSTLAWLQALPVDQVKIDRSFVRRLPHDAASLAVVRGVVALAEEIGLEVVAEGVEDAEQLGALRSAGCRWVQGYLLGRPAPVLDVALTHARGADAGPLEAGAPDTTRTTGSDAASSEGVGSD